MASFISNLLALGPAYRTLNWLRGCVISEQNLLLLYSISINSYNNVLFYQVGPVQQVFMLLVQAAAAKEKNAPTITSQAMVEGRLEPSESPNFVGYVPLAPFSCRLFNRSKTDALGIVIIGAKRTFLIGGPWGCGPVSYGFEVWIVLCLLPYNSYVLRYCYGMHQQINYVG